jgi:hypothetical protein
MKRYLCILIGLASAVACAAPVPEARRTHDGVVLSLIVPDVKRVVPTSYGYRIETDAGCRTAYRTATGYYVDGGGGSRPLDVRDSPAGVTVQDAMTRGDAIHAAQESVSSHTHKRSVK